jgi:hypothetical protein
MESYVQRVAFSDRACDKTAAWLRKGISNCKRRQQAIENCHNTVNDVTIDDCCHAHQPNHYLFAA